MVTQGNFNILTYSAGDGCKNCSFSDKKIILGSIILQTILIIFRGGAIEYLLFLGNGC